MAKCKLCGKWGLFLKVDKNGCCSKCAIEAEHKEKITKVVIQKKSDDHIGGDIGYLKLNDFWLDLNKSEKDAIIKYTRSFLGSRPDASPIKGDSASNLTKLSFLSGYIDWASRDKNYHLAEKLIVWCEKYYDTEPNQVTRHFYLHQASKYYYSLRNIRPDACDMVEKYCLRDIEAYSNYIPILSQGCASVPFVESFKRLAIMYEKNGRYEDAINICEKAISCGQSDDTKSGYSGRIEKLRKKIHVSDE